MSKLQVDTEVPEEIRMTRTFDAPRRLLIKAMSTPELIKRWHGGKRSTVVSAEMDYRVGGSYRIVFQVPGGPTFSFSGVYSEVSDDRVVHTELFNGEPPGAVVTTTFSEHGGKTTMVATMRFESQAVRDQVLATGMADGAGESYDELEKLVASL